MIKQIIVFVSILGLTLSWSKGGHIIVADIALKTTLLEFPESKSFFEDLTKVMIPMTHDKVSNFIESSIWPDLLRSYGSTLMDVFHFTNAYYNETMTNMTFIDPYKETASSISLVVSIILLFINLA